MMLIWFLFLDFLSTIVYLQYFNVVYKGTFIEILLVINQLIGFKIQLKATGPKTRLMERKINFEIE